MTSRGAGQAHTAGPWMLQHTAGHATHGQTAVYAETSGKDIAIVYDGEADATLIATAPELYNLAQAIAFDPYSLTPDQWRSEANQVLSKARGGK